MMMLNKIFSVTKGGKIYISTAMKGCETQFGKSVRLSL